MCKTKMKPRLLEKISRKNTVYTYSDVDTGTLYLIDNPSYMPTVITLTNGTLDRPYPWDILLWRLPVILPFIIGICHIKMTSIIAALIIIMTLWVAATVQEYMLSKCYLRTYDVTQILWHGGTRYEKVSIDIYDKSGS